MSAKRLPAMPSPCEKNERTGSGACPWRLDAEPGEFTAARFEMLAATVGTPEHDVPISGRVFACHNTREGGEVACAGALRVAGEHHVRVRLLVALGALPADAIGLRDDEPELFSDYDTMAVQQAAGVYQQHIADVYRARAGFGPYATDADRARTFSMPACAIDDVDERGSAGPDTRRPR